MICLSVTVLSQLSQQLILFFSGAWGLLGTSAGIKYVKLHFQNSCHNFLQLISINAEVQQILCFGLGWCVKLTGTLWWGAICVKHMAEQSELISTFQNVTFLSQAHLSLILLAAFLWQCVYCWAVVIIPKFTTYKVMVHIRPDGMVAAGILLTAMLKFRNKICGFGKWPMQWITETGHLNQLACADPGAFLS